MIKRKEIEEIFGKEVFEHGLFYLHDGALRFELSISGSATDMFACAFDKARELCRGIFIEGEPLGVCLSFYGGQNFLSALSFFRDIQECGIMVPKGSECWCIRDPDDDGFYRHFILFQAPYSYLTSLLWGALAQDLGIRPRIKGSTYIFSLKNSVLVHPYDDRGMDIISPNRQLLTGLYQRYNCWLLDYDREIMDEAHRVL